MMNRSMACVFIGAAALASGCFHNPPVNVLGLHPAQTNPSDFALYQPSTIVGVAQFDTGALIKSVQASEAGKSNSSTPPPPYHGTEVVATTPASLDQLRSWLGKREAAPPTGLKVKGSQSDESRAQMGRGMGFFGTLFSTQDDRREVSVILMDPKIAHDHLGVALDLIDKYQSLPAPLRAGVDAEAKRAVGFTVSDMLDPASPVGMVVSALKNLPKTNQRAIILVDMTKD